MTALPVALPRLGDHLDPVVDEPWLVADELLTDLRESLLPADLAAPLRACLLLVRDRLPELAERMTPARLAAGVAWVVGKANAAIGPEGPVTQVRIADHLGTTSLNACGNQVLGHVRRLGWTSARPWACGAPALLAVGRVELLVGERAPRPRGAAGPLARGGGADHHHRHLVARPMTRCRPRGTPRRRARAPPGGRSSPAARRRCSVSCAERSEELPDGQVAVAGAEERGLDRVGGAGPPEPALLAQHDRLRVLGAGAADGLLLDVVAGAQVAAQQLVVGEVAQVADRGAPVVDRRPDGLLDVVRPLDQLVLDRSRRGGR